jgi:hypothetical protein
MARILPLLLLASVAFAGSLTYKDDFMVNWTISNSQVMFTVTVKNDIAKDADWWGFGVGATGNSGMANTDIALIVKVAGAGQTTLTDRWASVSTYPNVDASNSLT